MNNAQSCLATSNDDNNGGTSPSVDENNQSLKSILIKNIL